MSRSLILAGLLAAVAVGGPWANLKARAAAMTSARTAASDRTQIEAVLADESAAWDRGDAEGFAAHVAPDVVFTNLLGLFSVGRAPFVAQHVRIFSTIYKGSRMSQAVTHLAMVRPDVAVVDTLTRVSGFVHLPPGMQAIDGVLQTRLEQVMTREVDGWRVAAFHNVTISPNPAPPGPPAAH